MTNAMFEDLLIYGIAATRDGVRINPQDLYKEQHMSDQSIEQQIQAKGLTAPRVTPADIEANIKQEYYFTAGDGFCGATGGEVYPSILGLLTFCVLELQNGFTVTGESACASPANFDAEIGRKIARQNAVQKIWPLMGYELKSKLAAATESEGGEL